MKGLIIDVTADEGLVILNIDGNKKCKKLDSMHRSGEYLLEYIDALLLDNEMSIKDTDYIGVISGPGSFTGIRVGLATAKALVFALNKNVIVKNVFDVLSFYEKECTVLIPCTKTSTYYGDIRLGKLQCYGVWNNVDIKLQHKPYVISDRMPYVSLDAQVIDDWVEKMADYFEKCAKDSQFARLNEVTPFYIQLSQAERGEIDKSNYSAKSE